ELPLRVTRDLFTGDFERALVDDDRALKRIQGYLKKTSPHMVERVERYKEKERLFEAAGVDKEIRSTLSRRVDLPSGGYLIFDYAEAFTVIDVNTGRFVGSRSKSGGARLEDTITKNNLEAVKEVVRQLRLRDIGGIIVIDFIDMANPKNRAAVEEALRTELERDRTKTYVVEISPLGLVEMTRQNVTDGPREIITRKCPTCEGAGVVVSETSHAVDAERRLRALVSPGSRVQAYAVELHPKVVSILVGAGGERLAALEEQTRRRFFLRPAEENGHVHLDHFAVLGEGKLEELRPQAPVEEGQELELKLVEVGRWDPGAATGKVDGYEVAVAGAAKLVGKKVKARVGRVLDGTAYATVLGDQLEVAAPVTAESEAEKPTRTRRSRLEPEAPVATEVEAETPPETAPEAGGEAEADGAEAGEAAAVGEDGQPRKKRTRRGTRGGRRRKKKPDEAAADATPEAEGEAQPVGEAEPAEPDEQLETGAEAAATPRPRRARIHVPTEEPSADGVAAAAEQPDEAEEEPVPASAEGEGAGDQPAKKRSRRGSRGGRRRKKPVAPAADAEQPVDEPAMGGEPGSAGEAEAVVEAEPEGEERPEPAPEPEPEAVAAESNGAPEEDWEYVPMSEWRDWERR
ncbi:MAG TPA: ribonuclease E/G, partial [Gaiellaceae bacterium]|nr:ribonuclease E/G [Gaiellaceae bacterium]